MSNWQLIKQNMQWLSIIESTCYTSSEFPLEVRDILSDWLDMHDAKASFLNFEVGNQEHHISIVGFLRQMAEQLELRTAVLPETDSPSFFYKFRLRQITQQIKEATEKDPLTLFNTIHACLMNECWQTNILSGKSSTATSSKGLVSSPKSFSDLDNGISEEIHEIKMLASTVATKIDALNSEYQNLNGMIERRQIYQQQVMVEVNRMREKVSELVIEVQRTMMLLARTNQTVIQEVEAFKDEQRFVSLGKAPFRNLERIDKWFEGVSECLSALHQCLPYFTENLCSKFRQDLQPGMFAALSQIQSLRESMIRSSLVIEKEPNQIVRKDAKSGSITLRILTCSTNMMVVEQNQKLATTILINDQESRNLASKSNDKDYVPKETTSATLDFALGYPSLNKTQIEFKDMKIQLKSRGNKKGKTSVVEEKFCIYFKLFVNVSGTVYQLSTLSLPLTITAHPSQEDAAWSAILWHNAFPTRGRQSLQVPDEVPWSALIEVIDLRFLVLGKELSEANKTYLKTKLFQGNVPENEIVTRKLFCKDPFVCRSSQTSNSNNSEKTVFTFWEWLWCCLKLLSWVPQDVKLAHQSLKKMWREDKIIGFMSEFDLKDALMKANQERPGTFIIRFPERRPESIGIYYYNPGALIPSESLVKLVYNADELKIKSLRDRIIDSPLLTYLYPYEPKSEAFKGSSSTDHKIIDGYHILGVREYYSKAMLERLQPRKSETLIYAPPSFIFQSSSPSTANFINSPDSMRSEASNSAGYNSTITDCDSGNGTDSLDEILSNLPPYVEVMEKDGEIQSWMLAGMEDAQISNTYF